MVAFSGLVVVTHYRLPALTAIQPVFESMRPTSLTRRQTPYRALHYPAILQNSFAFKNKRRLGTVMAF